MDVAIVIVSWNVRHFLANCLRSTLLELDKAGLNGAIWLVDNASTDGTVKFAESLYEDAPNVYIIANADNRGFGGANNQGMAAAMQHNPRYLFLLNPDTVVLEGGIGRIVTFMDNNPKVGMAGAKLKNSDGSLQHSAFKFPGISQLLFEFYPLPARLYESSVNGRYPATWYNQFTPFKIDHPLGAAMMVRQTAYRATNGFDTAFHMYCEEIDWAWRIKQAGWEIYTVPTAEIVHYGGQSTGQVRAQSVINLWRSRAQLYGRYIHPFKRKICTKVVQHGLTRLGKQSDSAELKSAYKTARATWV